MCAPDARVIAVNNRAKRVDAQVIQAVVQTAVPGRPFKKKVLATDKKATKKRNPPSASSHRKRRDGEVQTKWDTPRTPSIKMLCEGGCRKTLRSDRGRAGNKLVTWGELSARLERGALDRKTDVSVYSERRRLDLNLEEGDRQADA